MKFKKGDTVELIDNALSAKIGSRAIVVQPKEKGSGGYMRIEWIRHVGNLVNGQMDGNYLPSHFKKIKLQTWGEILNG